MKQLLLLGDLLLEVIFGTQVPLHPAAIVDGHVLLATDVGRLRQDTRRYTYNSKRILSMHCGLLTDIWRNKNVIITSKRRRDVVLTL